MTYIITAIISAMIGGAVWLFFGCGCAVIGWADDANEKGGMKNDP